MADNPFLKPEAPRRISSQDASNPFLKIEEKKEEPSNPVVENLKQIGRSALGGLATAGEYISRYSAAPTRSAISKLQEDFTDIPGAASAFANQLGRPSIEAPSGRDIALRASVPEKYADIAGLGLELAADPTSPILGAAGKAAGLGAKAARAIGLAKPFENVAETLRGAESALALKAIGANKSAFKKFGAKSKDITDFAKEEGILRLGSSPAAIEKKSEQILGQAGSKIGEIFNELDQSGKTFNRAELVNEIKNSVRRDLGKGLDQRKAATIVDEYLDDFLKEGPNATASEVQALRQNLDRNAKFERRTPTAPIKDEAFMAARNAVSDNIGKFADSLGGQIGTELKQQNRRYHLGSIVNDLSMDKAAGEKANMFFSLPEYISGAAAAGSGGFDSPEDILKGIGTGLLVRGGRRFGPAAVSGALSRSARIANALPKALGSAESLSSIPALGNAATVGAGIGIQGIQGLERMALDNEIKRRLQLARGEK